MYNCFYTNTDIKHRATILFKNKKECFYSFTFKDTNYFVLYLEFV